MAAFKNDFPRANNAMLIGELKTVPLFPTPLLARPRLAEGMHLPWRSMSLNFCRTDVLWIRNRWP
jgi:hypothetical protein